MNNEVIVLKTDIRGRVRTPARRREELLDEFARSGLPATKFAALAGVRYQTFATWVQMRRKHGASPKAPASPRTPRLVRAGPAAPLDVGGGSLQMRLPDGACLHITAALIKALDARVSC